MNLALIAGGVGVLLAAGVAVQTARLDAAQTREQMAREAAEANAKVVETLKADAARSADIVRDQAAALSRLQNARTEVIREIVKVPTTTACAGSPAVGVALDGLRRWPNAAADGRPPAAGRPDGAVRAPPAAPGARQQ